ncbi:hypothetical protein BKP45_14420 [Anaerobacillus alkalidiazotrophicus]|uniref:Uncharacterized protein n=1 Tax=Anaerobacillus alkalidiazotrophicus TaxID=472963 RepID=A0A1S2M383_9BACI|nr:hypothetical protein [Anaerobacillus alkalidiazotrophicus]OIJ19046.1 hypothetical protein BKP45_14420 [Anaerobacillus alkalidiazotrophicus]
MLLVCKNHIKQGLQYLNAPHIVPIKDKNFQGCCVFCEKKAEFKLFYSVPIAKIHRMNILEKIKLNKI